MRGLSLLIIFTRSPCFYKKLSTLYMYLDVQLFADYLFKSYLPHSYCSIISSVHIMMFC
uniref:Uncharacterized protein n=1 Tax=Arundo donax TaxID=35708 RepID=A0A0A9G3H9_ARUDO